MRIRYWSSDVCSSELEDMKAHLPAEIEASIRLRYAAIGELAHPHGAMFVPCLHRRGPAQQEDLGRRAARIQIARPVVLDLVIVERRHERRGGMRGPQIGIDLVERVAPPVIVEAVDLVAVMVADDGRLGGRRRAGGLSL